MTPKKLSIAFCIEPDENCFEFKIIFATGVTVDRHHEDRDIYIKRYTMMPVYVRFGENLFMFQQVLVYGKDFEVIENEQFFKNGSFDTTNKYYVGDDYMETDNFYDEPYFSQSLKYFNLDYVDCYDNDNDITDVSVNPDVEFDALLNETLEESDDSSEKNENNNLREKIRDTIEGSDFVGQIKSIVCKNPSIVSKTIHTEKYFTDDLFETKCDVDFYVIEGYIEFEK